MSNLVSNPSFTLGLINWTTAGTIFIDYMSLCNYHIYRIYNMINITGIKSYHEVNLIFI